MTTGAQRPRPRGQLWLAWVLLCLGVLGLAAASVRADSYDERRVRSGARLVRTLLMADQALESKADAGALHILIYAQPRQPVEPIARLIAPAGDSKRGQIRGLELQTDVVNALPPGEQPRAVALFLASPLDDAEFNSLLQWCIEHGVILYSPFEGDVERGATAGLSVQAKVQPFVNLSTLRSSGIELRRFFLDQSRVWP